MDWIKVSNKEVLPEEGKTYWVTVNFLGGFMAEATYKNGKWYSDRRKVMTDVVAWYPVAKPEMYKIPEPEGLVFPEFEVNERGINKNIKINVLEDKKMREIGFTDFRKDTWYFSRMLKKEISFSLSVNKENPADFRIDVLDDDFCQPYDYQSILSKNKNHQFAKEIMVLVEKHMAYLAESGIVEGHIYGEYI